jgi:Ca2+-binding RTX toxin-like protein
VIKKTRFVAAAAVAAIAGGVIQIPLAGAAPVAPVGSGFTVNAADLAFILKQIKIAEAHAATATPANPCGTLVGSGPNQIPDYITPYGLRTVDGSCNNLIPGREKLAAADVPFPRLTTPVFKAAEPITPSFPVGAPGPTSYAQKRGSVIDSQPRVISNLIDDQSDANPAAVAAAGDPVRTQGNTGVFSCAGAPNHLPAAVPPYSVGCIPVGQTLFIPNVTTDVGLSPPYNSLFTFFGQFFDHGVDQTVKSGGTVFVPLHADDPLIAGPDMIPGNADDPQPGNPLFVPVNQRFMVLTRAQNQPGADGVLGDNPATPVDESADDVQNANNTDTPWVDQSQTYTSHSSHQVFLREYVNNTAGRPVSTGSLLGGPAGNQAGGMAPWSQVKLQARTLLGLNLTDRDVTNIPMIAADPYGKFLPGPARGLPQYVTATGLVEGNVAAPVSVPANVLHFDTPFLTDIAHNADPSPQDTDNNPSTPPVNPTPDTDTVASADFAAQAPGTYDNEMLDAHFICGDGRCNENIALTTIHQVFHSEHDRLVGDMKNTINGLTGTANTDWHLATGAAGWNGERLFQAARMVTEMEYQHLVFEEFARKVQPAVRPFHVYSTDINPAINAEFAAAVYRFGHSMLDETVARTNPDGTDNSTTLLNAFLNPPEYTRSAPGTCTASTNSCSGGPTGVLNSAEAAGAVVMGSSDQVGNELDEFVTNQLRNNLLGLPLDLPTLNITRARDVGIPPLNEVRRQINASTNDAQLAPYTSWVDYGQHLKHPESLVNFVAAYGTAPAITSATTLLAKRAAAQAMFTAPTAADTAFLNSPAATSGLNNVDLWNGGLAEVTNLFGGLLGTTFNYVFQTQLESLQDGDRLYYLNRTQGMNLRTQLEGNSFSELIERNTEGTNTLKADAFSTADCKFQLANLGGTAADFAVQGAVVADDLTTTDCNENLLLLRKPDGTIAYKAVNSVDPVGINGQSVYNGSPNADRVIGGNDNDTIWGNLGNDVIEGNGGDDVVLGGAGNDIVTDLGGADVLKGGPGNDALDGGIGDDIFMGGDGQDWINGGANDNESFAGPSNDFVIAGQGADTVFGDSGDDWIQGGSGQDLLQGDHGAAFFDDPGQVAPGNDIFVGQVGENDYDAEGGDDLMAQNSAIDRNAGAAGFDWAFHQYDTVPAADDMMINNNLVGVPIQVVVNRDRWQETEADSGAGLNDSIKGTSGILSQPALVGGGGFVGCDALDAAGIARIAGLNALITPAVLAAQTTTAASVKALSAVSGECPLGPLATSKVWGDGDILIGGLGSDTIEGRGGNDVIDGDRYLETHITVQVAGVELGRTDLMEHVATAGNFGPGTAGMTLQQAVFAGLVDPGNLVAVREIVTPTAAQAAASAGGNLDTAVFTNPASNYTVVTTAGVTTVTDNGGGGGGINDGVDTLRNIEQLRFSDSTVSVIPGPVAPVINDATVIVANAPGTVRVRWTPSVTTAPPVTSQEVHRFDALGVDVGTTTVAGNVTATVNVTGIPAGTYTFKVRGVNTDGAGPFSAATNAVTINAVTIPGAASIGLATPQGTTSAIVRWTAPAVTGGSAITGYDIQVLTGGTTQVGALRTAAAGATQVTVTGLTTGAVLTFRVRAKNIIGVGPYSAQSVAVRVGANLAPVIGTATSGVAGGNVNVTANWNAPANNGAAAITSYRIQAFRIIGGVPTAQGAVVVRTPAQVQIAANSYRLLYTNTLPAGTYQFTVVAVNAVGTSASSALSNTAVAQ